MNKLLDRIQHATADELRSLRKLLESRAEPEYTAEPKKKDKHKFTSTERVTLDYEGEF